MSSCFNSDAPLIVDNTHLQKVKEPRHLQFMKEQRDKGIRLSHFSSAFSALLPGMMSIPLWVIPKPHLDKWHLVVDHSVGDYSPNLFISPDNASVHLGTLHVLRKALLKIRAHHGNVHLVLFKTDISQAYLCLPVHPLWQMCQIVKILNSYHINNNNNFSNQGAGCLWLTFFSLVLWIATVIM